MENQDQFIAPLQNAPTSSAYTKETDDLLKKYLKMQIGLFYWKMITNVVIFVFIIGSTVFSIISLIPFIQKQMEMLSGIQSTISGNGSSNLDVNAIIEQLNKSK